MPDPKSPETEAGATATPETETTNLPEPEATIEDAPTETETEAAETAEGTEEEKGKKKDWNPDLAKLNQERANFRKEQEAAEAKLAAAKAALEAEKAKLANAKPPEPDPEDAEMAEVKKLLVQADEMSDPDKDEYDPVAAQRLKIKADLKKVDIEEKQQADELDAAYEVVGTMEIGARRRGRDQGPEGRIRLPPSGPRGRFYIRRRDLRDQAVQPEAQGWRVQEVQGCLQWKGTGKEDRHRNRGKHTARNDCASV